MSFRPLATTSDYYMAFLDGIRREYTTIVPPVLFNRIINEAELEWITTKIPTREFVQKRIDDINMLRVATDNTFMYNDEAVNEIKPSSENFFPVPRKEAGSYDETTGMVKMIYDDTVNQVSVVSYYPIYLSGCRVDFRLASSPSEWTEAKILRSDDRGHLLKSPFRSPRQGKIYYEVTGKYIRAYLPSGETALGMNLEYYTYPRKVYFDETNQSDNANFPDTTDGKNPYEAGYGSINSIFEEYQKREILDIAVRIFLERRSDARYKTVLNESAIKQSKQ